jgi:CRISPR/Cas system-associated endonuclease Cas1
VDAKATALPDTADLPQSIHSRSVQLSSERLRVIAKMDLVAVLTAMNTGMVTTRDFVRAGGAVALTAGGRKAFFRAYEMRMDTLVTHPLFDYRVSYRRMLEIQSRLLARVLEGEIGEYPVFTTR